MEDSYRMITVTLACHHRPSFREARTAPAVGESIYCTRCTDYQQVVVSKTNHRVRCRDCQLSGKDIANLDTARRKASRHVMKRATHRVDIFDGDKKVETITQDKGQGELPYDSVIADSLAFVSEHQRVLREALLPNRDRPGR